ncbi:MAG: hypothetical protein K5656_09340, partial [Lachnospiraceae bacterium]|nr:hypothetical protein [Lachnospiraceae bacterium]
VSDNINEIGDAYKHEPISFYIDDQLVGQVEYQTDDNPINLKDIPEVPEKKGTIFEGWYYRDSDGNENPFVPIAPCYELKGNVYVAYDVYAKYMDKSSYVKLKSLKFPADTIYVPLENSGLVDANNNAIYSPEGLLLNFMYLANPVNATYGNITWYSGPDEDHLTYLESDGLLTIDELGEQIVVGKTGDVKVKVKVVGVDAEEVEMPSSFSISKNLSMDVGNGKNLNLKFNKGDKYISYKAYDAVNYEASNNDIVDIDDKGNVIAKKAGSTVVYAKYYTDENNLDSVVIRSCVVNVTVPKPAKPSVKSLTKKSAKKLNLKLVKKNVTGYQIAVYKSKADAKANKNAIATKTVKKTNLNISSKKFKKCKKLYIKLRAYNESGKKKAYSSWLTKTV